MRNKRAVSLMLSYVLLIIIGIALSIGVYSWLKFVVKGTEGIEKCPEGISLVIMDYKLLENKKIELNVKNKGLFNISGYYIKGTDDKNQEAWFNLKDVMAGSISSAVDGTYLFLEPLPPNAENSHVFLYDGLDKLEKIELEPFRIQEKESLRKKKIVLCEQGVISQEISLECRVDEDCDSYEEIYCDSLIGDVYKRDYSCINNKCIPGYSELITPCTGLCVFKSCINGLVSFWRFDETDGIAYDSANGNNGKIYGNTRLLMHFDESSGNPQDGSAYNNSGVITGATWAGSGCQSGSCLNFDGVDDYVNVGNNASLNFSSGDFTYSAWIKTSASNVNKRIIAHDGNLLNNKALIVDSSGANIDFWCRNASGNAIVVQGSININDSQWHYVVGVRKGSTGYVYIDGNPDGSATSALTGSCDGNVNTFIGARDYPAGPLPFNGSIDEVAIYSRALSQSEITEHFTAGRAKFIERVPGKSENAISFDGIDDYAEANVADIKNTTVFWYKNSTATSWTFVANSSGTLYVNGILGTPSQYPIYISGNAVQIGKTGASTYFNGSIDEVMVFNQALSQENITSIYRYYTG